MKKGVRLLAGHIREITAAYIIISAGELALGHPPGQWWILLLFNLVIIPLGIGDMHYWRLFNELVLVLAMGGIVLCVLWPEKSLADGLMGALTFGGSLYLIRLLSRGNLGLGDVKLGLGAGLWLGQAGSVVALYLSFILGGLYVAAYCIMGYVSEGQGGLWAVRKKQIPFGPFLALGSSMGLMCGERVLMAYLTLWW